MARVGWKQGKIAKDVTKKVKTYRVTLKVTQNSDIQKYTKARNLDCHNAQIVFEMKLCFGQFKLERKKVIDQLVSSKFQ